jgi:hypothetical protein
MSRKYKFGDNDKLYFVSFAVTNWIDLFVTSMYNEIIVESIPNWRKVANNQRPGASVVAGASE